MTPLDPPLVFVILAAAILIPLGDLAAAGFIFFLFMRSKAYYEPGTEAAFVTRVLHGRSWLLFLLTAKSLTVAIVYIYFAALTARRVFHPDLSPLPWSPITSTIALILLGTIPIAFMLAFVATRRRRRNGTPRPFSDRD